MKWVSRQWVWGAIVLFAFLVFWLKFDPRIIWPENVNWMLLRGSDFANNLLAWEFFRISDWSFPVGKIERYSYPNEVSIGLTGGIPLLALFVKIWSFLLPVNFQYFGSWLLICYLLQGIMGVKLLRALGISDPWFQLFGGVLFLLAPPFLDRSPHLMLCCHWLILGAFTIYFRQNDILKPRKKLLWHLLLIALSALIFPYWLLFMLPMAAATIGKLWVDQKVSLPKAVVWLLLGPLLAFVIWWVVGNFIYSLENTGGAGVGYYSANLNTLINAGGKGIFLPALPYAFEGQYEGYGYLGAGVLAILICCLVFVRRAPRFNGLRHWPLLLVVFLLTVFSFSNKITLNQHLLLEYPIGIPLVEQIFQSFRSTGRFIWVLHYGILLFALYTLTHLKLSRGLKIAILALGVLLQAVDMQKELKWEWYEVRPDRSFYKEALWNKLFEEADKIIMYPPYKLSYQQYGDHIDFAHLAYLHKKPITAGFLARNNPEERSAFRNELLLHLSKEGLGAQSTSVFITPLDQLKVFEGAINRQSLQVYNIENYGVLVPSALNRTNDWLRSKSYLADDSLAEREVGQFIEKHTDHHIYFAGRGVHIPQYCPGLKQYLTSEIPSRAGNMGGDLGFFNSQKPFLLKIKADQYVKIPLLEPLQLLAGWSANRDAIARIDYIAQQLLNPRGNLTIHKGLLGLVIDDEGEVMESAFFHYQDSCRNIKIPLTW